MPVGAKREHEFDRWNLDAIPLLDAIDAGATVLHDAGHTKHSDVSIGLEWPEADAHESSTAAARRALITAGPLSSANLSLAAWSEEGSCGSVDIDLWGSGGWAVTTRAPDVALVEQLHSVVVEQAQRAARPPGSKSAAESVTEAGDHRPGMVGWMERHPALVSAIVGGLGIATAVVVAIAEN
jgi:hypothetical protein